jgi:GxxExxY protein
MVDLKHASQSYEFMGCAMAVHRELGPGLDECYYHAALQEALTSRGLEFQHKPRGRLIHREFLADQFEADFVGNPLSLGMRISSYTETTAHQTPGASFLP